MHPVLRTVSRKRSLSLKKQQQQKKYLAMTLLEKPGGCHFEDGRVLVVVRRAGTDQAVFCVL